MQIVVTTAPDQLVVAAEPHQYIVAAVAGDGVVARAAGAVDGPGGADQEQTVDVRRQRVGNRRVDRVDAAPGALDDGVRCVVDVIGVVAGTADQPVDTATAIEHIATGTAGDGIGAPVADHVSLRCHDQRRLDAVGHGVGDVGGDAHQVGTAIGQFDDGVTRHVDHEGVVAGASHQRVDAGVAIQPIITGTAFQPIRGLVAVDDVVEPVA